MKSHVYKLWYHGVSFYMVIYVIPLILLATLTYKLVKAVREARQKRAQLASSEASTNPRKSDEDVTVSLVAVVCVFLLHTDSQSHTQNVGVLCSVPERTRLPAFHVLLHRDKHALECRKLFRQFLDVFYV